METIVSRHAQEHLREPARDRRGKGYFIEWPALRMTRVAAFMLLIIGCGPAAPEEESPTDALSGPKQEAAASAEGGDQYQVSAISAPIIRARIASADKPVIVSLWASWSRTAREATTDLLPLQRAHQAGRIDWVFVCIDTPRDTRERSLPWLRQQGLEIPIHHKSSSQTDVEFVRGLEGEWTGTIPTTMVFAPGGGCTAIFEEPVRATEVLEAVKISPMPQ